MLDDRTRDPARGFRARRRRVALTIGTLGALAALLGGLGWLALASLPSRASRPLAPSADARPPGAPPAPRPLEWMPLEPVPLEPVPRELAPRVERASGAPAALVATSGPSLEGPARVLVLDDPRLQPEFARLRALARSDPEAATPGLLHFLQRCEGQRHAAAMRLSAIELLGQSAGGLACSELARAGLRATYASGDELTQLTAARALERLGDPSAMRAQASTLSLQLATAAAGQRDNRALRIARIGSPALVPLLEELLGDASARVRCAALDGLERSSGGARPELVTAALADPDPEVRARARLALRARHGRRAKPAR